MDTKPFTKSVTVLSLQHTIILIGTVMIMYLIGCNYADFEHSPI